ncbi:alpha-L-rhamnosidase [Novosphingobium sp. ST904]|uniref:alpha-L-rhamnosidase n=1 Tax=Novosphingobium sp. ST904 TaxID=1684385 RepID=UPI0006C8DC60|nr:alpha-L-rhamnosidase [Novosphingobium sp. ST904]KPH68157.1 alpha-L-rhamnosidase [Novosphingobium sp. ST904]
MPNIDRRSLLVTGALAATTAAGSRPGSALAAQAMKIVDLKTAGRLNPIGIGEHRPALSWRMEGPAGTEQKAWRVLVASSPAILASGRGDLWDSGRVEGSASTGIRYDGAELASTRQCHWKVCCWNSAEQRAWSTSATWEMGYIVASDWTGKWLAAEAMDERIDRLAAPEWVLGSSPGTDKPRAFRLPFTSGKGPAVVTIVADGALSRLAIDGRPLTLPARDPNAFGGAPAAKFELELGEGDHLLSALVAPVHGFFVKPTVMLASLVRVTTQNGDQARIASGWQTQMPTETVWSMADKAENQPNFPWPPTPARMLRRNFSSKATIARARLHVAALAGYRFWINAARVGDDELQAEPVDYSKRVPVRTYDVTHLLRKGENVVAALVGDGNFASYQAPEGRYPYLGAPRRFQAVLEIFGDDGAIQRVVSDGDWRHKTSHLTMSENYAGEDQDLRLLPDGWNAPGYDDTGWESVWEAPDPQLPLSAAISEPVRVIRELVPQSIVKLGEKRFVVDFGQNFAGRVQLRVDGKAGDVITVSHAEVLGGDGDLDRRNLRAARAQDRYILRGGNEVLAPVLTYQGFRYARTEGLDIIDKTMVTGLVLSSDIGEIGTLRVEEPRVQKLWLNALWSQRSNFMGIATDCPQRDERLGWTGDAQVFWDTASFNMNTSGFTRSFCRAMRDAQGKSGAFPLWAPNPAGLGWGTPSATPGWADAGVMLPYISYLHSGDATIVDENWQAMTSYLDGILATNPDGLWAKDRGADLGDWLALDAKSPMDETTPKALIATAMLARSIGQVAQMAKWTGRTDEAGRWQARLEQTKRAFRQAFVAEDGTVGNGSHCSFVLALSLDLLTDKQRASAGAMLAADIRRRGTLLSTGFLGTPLALDALASIGEEKLIWDLLLRRDYPSWGYMADHGATTIWERWNGDTGDIAMNSFNHYALGAVCGFLYRRVAGIAPIEPGFARFAVSPVMDDRIPSAGATLETVRGRVETRWRRTRQGRVLEIVVPSNSRATVALPNGPVDITAGSHRFVT